MITIKDNKYGCFTAYRKCDACGGVIFKKAYNWSTHKIGIGEKEKIAADIAMELMKADMKYCYRCGTKLGEVKE